LSLRPQASLVCTSATYLHASSAAATKTDAAREWLCTFTASCERRQREEPHTI
jgi:hypothetical protein